VESVLENHKEDRVVKSHNFRSRGPTFGKIGEIRRTVKKIPLKRTSLQGEKQEYRIFNFRWKD
jgi:hypothetical protein